MGHYAPVDRNLRFHLVAGLVTLGVGALLWWLYHTTTTGRLGQPARGYTTLGLTLGILAGLFFLFTFLYTWRKRAGQELLPGRLRTWLRLHVWLSLLAGWMILLHAGFHLDDALGTWTLVLGLFTVATGVIGWIVYALIPPVVARPGVGNLAIPFTERRIAELDEELDDTLVGASDDVRSRVASLSREGAGPVGAVVEADRATWSRCKELVGEIEEQRGRLAKQRRLRSWLRVWVWAHVPVAFVFVLILVAHTWVASEAKYLVRAPRPDDFADPATCASCHPSQYEEWLSSMHASAQMAPTVDLQTRLVMAKEMRDLASGAISKPIVGDLCVRCHAPTGSQSFLDPVEPPLARIEERAPASRFGVSCVTCHQISSVHPTADNDVKPGADPILFRNAENLAWEPGRVMRGPFGRDGELPSIGNREHEGRFAAHFDDPSFCASCHTVTTDDPVTGKRIVKLQDTYREWLEGDAPAKDARPFTWAEEGAEGIRCLDCHGRDLGEVVREVERWEHERLPLEERFVKIRRALRELQKRPVLGDDRAAVPPPGEAFDRELVSRRRHLHTFVGVDHPLEPTQPLEGPGPEGLTNATILARMKERTRHLLQIAAAVLIREIHSDGIDVDVMNLATGHKMPAGFAFAREMWLEVSVEDAEAPDGTGWRVLVGGDGHGRPVEGAMPLRKKEEGWARRLKNLQAVLFDGEKETVLQNETVAVLTGRDARAAGFEDREAPLFPGETRTLRIPLSETGGWAESRHPRLRVRLRFRNFPPEFIRGLQERLELELASHDNPAGIRSSDLARSARILDALYVETMAQDIR